MNSWYRMDLLRNVTGPHPVSAIRKFALQESNFWVGAPDFTSWKTVDSVREMISGMIQQGLSATRNNHQAHVLERCINELIGLCKGIIADGKVDQNEAEFLKSWLENNSEVSNTWPANVLADRLNQIFSDGVVDEAEQLDLAALLAKFTGVVPGVADAEQLATRLPVDDPGPDVKFEGKRFCLTGQFVLGSRQKCEGTILGKGGIYQHQPDFDSDYIVIGALGSRNWSHSPYGRKVEQVLANRDKGAKTAIVSEEHWTFFLNR